MFMDRKLLPVGIDDYKKLIDEDYYYVDKTLLIKDLINNLAFVNLFTRPRRFGKTLNLSMLRYFFEKPVDGSSNTYLFKDKKIMTEGEKYTAYQEQYPVIQLSLKSGKQAVFENACNMVKLEIAKEYRRHGYIVPKLKNEIDREKFELLSNENMESSAWLEALAFLSRCLEEYYQQKVIILIDEYDVPLENAYYCGFYKQMTDFIRSLFESALKSNPSLKFAVITGCLRISKESIFTGLNNLDVISILNTVYNEHFGFTQDEVNKLLSDYHIESKSNIIKEWYDGYIFGKTEVYNPWSLINYTRAAFADESALPVEYWSNTSSNSIIKDLLSKSTDISRDEIEILVQDGSIEKTVFEDITYQDIYENEENLWNFLFFTGYLKAVEVKMKDDDRVMVLKIPNKEIKKIYRQQIVIWSRNIIKSGNLSKLFSAVLKGDENILQDELAKILSVFISYMDNHEDFYHGFLLGILINMKGYKITSNREAGYGRYDLCIVNRKGTENPVIIEFKIADKKKFMENAAEKALKQIMEKGYDIPLKDDGYKECVHIGIGFCNKMCYVKCEIVTL